jgi:hypothetical protein
MRFDAQSTRMGGSSMTSNDQDATASQGIAVRELKLGGNRRALALPDKIRPNDAFTNGFCKP